VRRANDRNVVRTGKIERKKLEARALDALIEGGEYVPRVGLDIVRAYSECWVLAAECRQLVDMR
jgi:hypothetical protein